MLNFHFYIRVIRNIRVYSLILLEQSLGKKKTMRLDVRVKPVLAPSDYER